MSAPRPDDGKGVVSCHENDTFPAPDEWRKANIFNGRELTPDGFLYDGIGCSQAGHCKVHAA